MKRRNSFSLQCLALFGLFVFSTFDARSASLETVISAAIENDPWIAQSSARRRASKAEARFSGELPDPKISLSLANLPTDTFDFSQEPMTQVMVGLSQSFPSGDSRVLRSQRFDQLAQVSPVEQTMRVAQLRRDITKLWIEAALIDDTIALIHSDESLFVQLESAARASYSAGASGARQQDVIRAELERTRLQERLIDLAQSRAEIVASMTQWVPVSLLSNIEAFATVKATAPSQISIFQHPEVRVHDQLIAIAKTDYQLTEESKRPGFVVSAQYGRRDEDFTGRDLPDFISLGVSMDLPLFTQNRQDKKVEVAAERLIEAESARLLILRKLDAQKKGAEVRLAKIEEHIRLYENQLLNQMQSLADATLDAYANDQADFAEVAQAHIVQLNARIEHLTLIADREKSLVQLQYLAATALPIGVSL